MKIFIAALAFLAVISIGLPVRADAVADLLAALAGPVTVPVATTTVQIAATTTTATVVQSAASTRGSCMFGYHEAGGQCVSDIFPMPTASAAGTVASSGGISVVGASTSTTELMEIDALMAEIAHLKEVLVSLANNATATPAADVPTLNGTPFTRNLSYGSKGDDVKALQEFLIGIGILPAGDNTGFYGQATESAVQQYQIRNDITAIGTLASGFGVVGPKTRAAILAGDNAPALTGSANTPDTVEPTTTSTNATNGLTSTLSTSTTLLDTESPPVTSAPATPTVPTAPSESTPATAPFIPPPVETDTLPPPPTDVPSTSGDPATASTSTTDVPPPPPPTS